jgi:hypothetical protein
LVLPDQPIFGPTAVLPSPKLVEIDECVPADFSPAGMVLRANTDSFVESTIVDPHLGEKSTEVSMSSTEFRAVVSYWDQLQLL